jgi:predicted TIM-barrel fold metal-dependent hydrolase
MVVIDAHAHVWGTPETYPWEETGPGGAETLVYTMEDYRADMDTLGIDEAILVAVPVHGTPSPYVTEHADGDRFHAIVLLDYQADDIAEQVATALGHEGVLGVRLHQDEVRMAPEPFWRAMDERGGHVHLLIQPEHFPVVAERAASYPNVTFVVDHLGLPDVSSDPDTPPYDVMAEIAEESNTYSKITIGPVAREDRYPFESQHRHVRYLLEHFGADRLVWGSEYIYQFKHALPWQTIEFLEEMHFLSDSERRKLLGETMASLLEE